MKTGRYNLKKKKISRIFANFTQSQDTYIGILPLKFQEISSIRQRIIRSSVSLVLFEALSLLVY